MSGRISLRILLVEDDREDALLFRRHAAASTTYRSHVVHVVDLARAAHQLGEGRYDLVFLDLRLNGVVVDARMLRHLRDAAPDVPVIIFTGAADKEVAVEMMKAGATDFLFKDAFDCAALERCARYALRHRREVAERRRSEDALRESEERSRRLVGTAFDGINVSEYDPATGKRRLIFCNDRYVEMSGYTREELENADDLTHLAHAHMSDEELADLRECWRTGEPVSGTASWLRPDGKQNLYEFSALAVRMGDKYHFMGFDRDITERKRVEEALRASEEKYRNVVEHAGEGICILQDSIVKFANEQLARIGGYSVDEVLGNSFLDYVHPAVSEELTGSHERFMAGVNDEGTYEVALIRKDGRAIDIEFNMNATEYDGRRAGLVLVRDVTERKRAEEALRESARFLSSVFGSIQDGISVLDSDMRIVQVNPTLEKWYSHKMPLVGTKCYDGYHGRSTPCEACPSRRTLETGEAAFGIVPKTGPSGAAEGWVELYTFPLMDGAAGRRTGVIEYVRDITERNRAEEALRASEMQYRTTLDALADPVHVVDRDLRLTLMNPAFVQWNQELGLEAEPIGKTLRAVFPFLGPEVFDQYQYVFDTGEVLIGEEMMVVGGRDFITETRKIPVWEHGEVARIVTVVRDITERKRAEERMARHADSLRRQLDEHYEMVGESPAIKEVYDFIRKVAPTEAGVLICGESGTGKEIVARAIHRYSPRAEGPLEVVNCAAIPAALLEDELFGHVKGAFTGAAADRPGRFELADGGTLFLDEVVETPLECQVNLLRVLEEGTVRRIGDTRDRPVDVRVLAATNRDPAAALKQGRLRQDLFYRLDRLRLVVPPLRERTGDIALLVRHFLDAFGFSLKRSVEELAPEALEALQAYGWPGNVRELKNVMERMVILAERPVLGPADLPPYLEEAVQQAERARVEPLSEVERRHILSALQEADGNKKRAAEMLGIDRSTLYAKLKRYGISPQTVA